MANANIKVRMIQDVSAQNVRQEVGHDPKRGETLTVTQDTADFLTLNGYAVKDMGNDSFQDYHGNVVNQDGLTPEQAQAQERTYSTDMTAKPGAPGSNEPNQAGLAPEQRDVGKDPAPGTPQAAEFQRSLETQTEQFVADSEKAVETQEANAEKNKSRTPVSGDGGAQPGARTSRTPAPAGSKKQTASSRRDAERSDASA